MNALIILTKQTKPQEAEFADMLGHDKHACRLEDASSVKLHTECCVVLCCVRDLCLRTDNKYLLERWSRL